LSDNQALSKLRWHCRRGMRELDVLLEHYLNTHYTQSSKEQQQGFVELLTLEDPVLFAYLLGREQPNDKNMQNLVERIRTGLAKV